MTPVSVPAKHKLVEYQHDKSGYIAVCRCGWRSPSGSTIDDAWERHREHAEKEQGNG
jgi:hypothetical protein